MIFILFTFVVDLFLSNFISLSYQNIDFVFPSIMIVCIPIFYNILKSKKLFFLIMLIFGLIYDTLFSDIFFINTYYYLLFGFFVCVFYENYSTSLMNIVLLSIMGLLLYDVFICFVLIFIDYSSFSLYDLIYKLKRTLILNFIYLIFTIFIFRSRIFGLKRCKYR